MVCDGLQCALAGVCVMCHDYVTTSVQAAHPAQASHHTGTARIQEIHKPSSS